MSRLIDRAELFNRLANIKAPPEANEYKAEVYSLIQSMETADEIMPEGLVICSPSTAEHVEIVKAVGKWMQKEFGYLDLNRSERLIDAISTLPSADRPTGRWVPVTNGRGGHECDQCHDYAPSWATGEERLTNFCPNCGCRMEGGDDKG